MNIYYNKAKSKTHGRPYIKFLKVILQKLIQLITVLLFVSLITFVLTDLAPGDPSTAMYEAAGIIPTEEMLEATRSQLGLDTPLLERYFSWIGGVVRGDMGESFSQHEEVLTLILRNLKSTISLALSVLGVTLLVSLPLGIISAIKKNKFIDYIIRFTSFISIASPNYLVALILTFVFCYKLEWIPVFNPYGDFNAMILPVLSLALGMIADYIRQIRALFLEELSQGYVYGARARGVSEIKILFVHVMKNTMIPLITLISFSLGSLLGGVAIVEVIFSFPGLGNLMIYAVESRDYPLIQGVVLWIAMCYTVINICTDLLYRVVDPRVRKRAQGVIE